MRFIMMALTLLAVSVVSICPSSANPPSGTLPKGESAATNKQSILKMVHIRTTSPGAVRRLRAMHVDVIRVRPDPGRPPDKKSPAGGFIVEAVVPAPILPKLKAKGFDVSEVPSKHQSGTENRGDQP